MMKMRLYRIGFGICLILAVAACSSPRQRPSDEPILGIFGGMGPAATADLYRQIVALTPAEKDQDHIPTLIFSDPLIPDRMAAIRNQDLSIVDILARDLQRLERAGASLIAIPCNTVHYFYDYMAGSVDIPIIHMIRETALEVKELYPQASKVGILATTGTLESGLYHKELEALGLEVVEPSNSTEINQVMKAVFGIKAGIDPLINENHLAIAGQELADRGAEVIVLGCTEIPLAYNPERVDLPVVNATEVLALTAIEAYRQLK